MLYLDFASFKFPPSPRVIEVLKQNLHTINEYPDQSYLKLKKKLAQIYKLDTRNILIGNGLDEVIDLITRAFVREGEEVIIPIPTFSQFEQAAVRINAKAVAVYCMRECYEIDTEEILNHVTKQTRLIWICSPNNPTGDSTPLSVIRKIAGSVDTPVVIDNALGDFSDESVDDLADTENIIILRTFSKGYCLGGLRIGYAVADSQYIAKIGDMKQIFNVNSLGVEAAMAALEDQKYYDRLWADFKNEKRRVLAHLEEMGVEIEGISQSNFILMDLKSEKRSRDVYGKLLQEGIKVFPGWDEEFSGLSGRFLRVVVGRKDQNDTFLTTLRKICAT